MKHKILIAALCFILTIVLGSQLLPFQGEMFDFHDQTLPARVQQFSQELANGHIPPRIAPDFSFGMGYPVFTFYAPTAFYLTSILDLIGFSVQDAIKVSFLLAIATAFCGMYLFLRRFFDQAAALTGSFVYVTIPYLAVDIFVRGNLGEVWFAALLPVTLWSMHMVDSLPRRWSIICTTLLISALFTVHNIFSMVAIPLVIIYAIVLSRRGLQLGMIGGAIIIGASFFLPIALETGQTYATEVATKTDFRDHFLCPGQLWDGVWGFGGSVPGCDADGMSFKLGKIQILLTIAGSILLLASFPFRRFPRYSSSEWIILGGFLLLIGSITMTLELSSVIWELFSPILALFQFPWRFLLLTMMGMAFVTAYGVNRIPFFWKLVPALMIGIALVLVNQKYFFKPPLSNDEFAQKYLSAEYIATEVAYRIPEYFPRTGSYDEWSSYWQNDEAATRLRQSSRTLLTPADPTIETSDVLVSSGDLQSATVQVPGTYLINRHASGNWLILQDGTRIDVAEYDPLARPIIELTEDLSYPVEIEVRYQQTSVQLISTLISVLGLGLTIAGAYWYRNRSLTKTPQNPPSKTSKKPSRATASKKASSRRSAPDSSTGS